MASDQSTAKILEKAKFYALDPSDTTSTPDPTGPPLLEANFNPSDLTLEKSVDMAPRQNSQQPVTQLQVKGSSNATLSMTLFFDTYEEGISVRTKYMTKLESLLNPKKVDDKATPPPPTTSDDDDADDTTTANSPSSATPTPEQQGPPTSLKAKQQPSVLFVWGAFRFCGAIESLSQRYTMFLSNGTPVRAEATLSIIQTLNTEKDNSLDTGDKPCNPSDVANACVQGGKSSLDQMGSSSSTYDDPMALIDNANQADAANAAAAAANRPTGLAGFMGQSGAPILGAALGAALMGGGVKGVLGAAGFAAGATQLFGTTGLGPTLNALAAGNTIAPLATLAGSGPLGSFIGGIGLSRTGGHIGLDVGGTGNVGGTQVGGEMPIGGSNNNNNYNNNNDGSTTTTTTTGGTPVGSRPTSPNWPGNHPPAVNPPTTTNPPPANPPTTTNPPVTTPPIATNPPVLHPPTTNPPPPTTNPPPPTTTSPPTTSPPPPTNPPANNPPPVLHPPATSPPVATKPPADNPPPLHPPVEANKPATTDPGTDPPITGGGGGKRGGNG